MRWLRGAHTELPSLAPIAILAGGLGTRLGERARHTPKALVPVAGEPFLVHQLRLLARHGAHRVVLCVGFLGELVETAIGDGERFGLDVRYSYDGDEPAGTAGAIRRARRLLGPRFLVTYGDTYLRIDYRAVQARFDAGSRPALMTVLRNDGSWAQSNAVYENGRVTAYDKRVKPEGARWIDYGLLAFDQGVFAEDGPSDLSDTCRELAARGELSGYVAGRRFYEIGTPRGLAETDDFLRRHADG